MAENEFNALDERYERIESRLESCETYCKALLEMLELG